MKIIFQKSRGSIVVEASIMLPLFMFTVLTVLGVYYACVAQSRISMALNDTAKEISVYCYLYGITGASDAQAGVAGKGASAAGQLEKTANSIGSLSTEDLNTFTDCLSQLSDQGTDLVNNGESYLYYAGNQLIEMGKGMVIDIDLIAPLFMSKHFGDDPDAYLRSLGVMNGLDGLDFSNSSFCVDGGEEVYLIVTYDLKALELLNIDVTWHMMQAAHTKAWLGGVSKISTDTGSDGESES